MITLSPRLSVLLDPAHIDDAAQVVRRYFAPRDEGGFTGAHFERLGGGGDRPAIADAWTAEDLVAVSMLSVQIDGAAALEILEARADQLGTLLRQIPTTIALADLAASDLGESWLPRRLFRELMAIDGVGPTTAPKLLARKRPHLVPVYDTVVNRELSLVRERLWEPLHAWLVVDGRAHESHLQRIRDRAEVPDISVLRIFDVLAWMTGSDNVPQVAR